MSISHGRGRLIAVLATALLVFGLSACSSTADGKSDPGATSVDAASLAKAQALVDKYSAAPESLGISQPVGADIPTGVHVTFVTCGVEACDTYVKPLQQAADILGWKLKVIQTDGSSQQIQNAWDQVVREKPDVALYTGTQRELIAQQLKAAAANGTFIAAAAVDDHTDDALQYLIYTKEDGTTYGDILAAYVAVKSKGKGDAVYLNLPDYKILSNISTGFAASLPKYCAGCGHDQLDFGLADLTTMPDTVVSYLRAHPDVKWVVTSADSAFVSLPAALKAAGLDDVRIIGQGPAAANLQNIADGDEEMGLALAYYEHAFAMMDAAARHEAGVPLTPQVPSPTQILVKDNVPHADGPVPLVKGLADQMKKLWRK